MPHCMHADVSLSVMEELLKNVRWNHTKSLLFTSHVHTHTSSSILLGAYLSELRNCLLAASLLDCTASHLPAWRVHCEKGGYWLRSLSRPQWQSECKPSYSLRMLSYTSYILSVRVFSAIGGSGRWFWISAGYPRRGSIHRPAYDGVQCFPHHFHEGLHACGCIAAAEIRL